MSDHDPFTRDMFGSSQNALSSGLGLGVTAFSENPKAEPGDTEPAPVANSSGSPARKESAKRRAAEAPERGSNFHLSGSRALAKGWKARARVNLEAIALAAAIAAEDRPATCEEQARLIRFTGFGASDLANAVFARPGEEGFRKGWEDLGEELQASVNEADYASLARCTQYAHFTPEFIVRAIWKGLERLGWRGGRILDPGIGTGLFPALMPEAFREATFVTGVELDSETANYAERIFGTKVRSMYGTTEIGVIIANYPGADDLEVRDGAMGKAVPGVEVEVQRADGSPADPGETGELMVKKRGEWFPTKDLGRVDEDGYFYHGGRADDVIISAGWTIGAVEVEDAVLSHPAVAECGVIGAPDAVRGLVVKAYIILKAEETEGLVEDIQNHVRARLARHEYPRQIEFVSELPKTPAGKVNRKVLRDQEAKKFEAAE